MFITGIVNFRGMNAESKSDNDQFFLAAEPDNEVGVRVEGDNAFEQPTLRGLVGHLCIAEGEFDGEIFCVKIIKPLWTTW
jgi:hypothetical protein